MNSPAVSRTDCRQDLARNLIQHPEERYFMLYTFNDAAILDVIETLAYYERLQNQKDALSAGGRHLSARVNVRAYREIG